MTDPAPESTSQAAVAKRADRLYEYDREPVDREGLKPGRYFAATFAGEHVSAAEFVVGAFLVLNGVTVFEMLVGLFVGNLLAVLSWMLICAPIATDVRLTLYWYLRKIVGPGLTTFYNVINAVLYCILAGAMIAISTTAVGLGFGMPIPDLSAIYPPNVAWVAITFAIGAVITLIAVLGFKELSRFSSICAPWIFAVYIAGAIAMLGQLGVEPDLSNLWTVATTEIWNGEVVPGQEPFNVWHVTFFAWITNLAMHVGLSDMAIFRYAKNWKYGLYTAVGLYPGHMLAWICSGVMVAAVDRVMNPGLMAYEAVGLAGSFAVLIGGWTTANPTLYRAGLALQTITPDWKRWKVTLLAGAATTALACFPVIFLRLLDFVAIYGLILMPIGAIVFAEHWIVPRLGIQQYQTEKQGRMVNWKAATVWAATLLLCYLLFEMGLHLYYLWLPGYVFAVAAYAGLKAIFGRTSRAGVADEFNQAGEASSFPVADQAT